MLSTIVLVIGKRVAFSRVQLHPHAFDGQVSMGVSGYQCRFAHTVCVRCSCRRRMLSRGYAVCESFCTVKQVMQIREKVRHFDDMYERSEIWVGKNSDVGAQLQVRGACWPILPSVPSPPAVALTPDAKVSAVHIRRTRAVWRSLWVTCSFGLMCRVMCADV